MAGGNSRNRTWNLESETLEPLRQKDEKQRKYYLLLFLGSRVVRKYRQYLLQERTHIIARDCTRMEKNVQERISPMGILSVWVMGMSLLPSVVLQLV